MAYVCSLTLSYVDTMDDINNYAISYVLRDLPSRTTLIGFTMDAWCLSQPYRFNWTEIFTEAQEISERLNIDLSNISFGTAFHANL